jgi:hypothetical protein
MLLEHPGQRAGEVRQVRELERPAGDGDGKRILSPARTLRYPRMSE